MSDDRASVLEVCQRAKSASRTLRTLTTNEKNAAIRAIADALDANAATIIAANEQDVTAAVEAGTAAGIVDRLTLNAERLAAIADALRDVAMLPDPVGEVVRGFTLPNGLEVRQVRVPMGVVGMIYEARPNVTVDAAGLCLKSGNAAVLRGSSSAQHTNVALVDVMRRALETSGIPRDAIVLVPGTSHESVKHLMTARGVVDVLIPRGGEGLIRSVVDGSTVPVIETGVGNCHVYVDASADVEKAVAIVMNAKVQRPSVCNAAETVLVHEAIADAFLPRLFDAFTEAGVTVHGDAAIEAAATSTKVKHAPVTDEDWAAEYYSLDIAAGVVPDLQAAIEHIHTWSSGHTEAIVTEDQRAAREFVASIDAAAVMVNASTRFTDGGEFGFGAEIGISTQKLHARGPMGLAELTTTTYVVTGDGHIRA